MRLQDKVIVITGSTRGIGRAVADACGREGAKVVISSRHEEAVADALAAFRQAGWHSSGIAADVSRSEDLAALLQHALATWGRVDAWVNNAGISGPFKPLDEMTAEEISAVVDTNLVGTLNACRLLVPYFRENKGLLVNLSGRGGRGDPVPYLIPYAATKTAVVSLTKGLAKENEKYPFSIHAVLPGMVATDFYANIESSPHLAPTVASIPYVLRAIGVPVQEVAEGFVGVLAQEPGKTTGKVYSFMSRGRLIRGIFLLTWYRLTGKIR
ncbi:MAG: SDR family oxidoreductase [Chloroflexota bacterium]